MQWRSWRRGSSPSLVCRVISAIACRNDCQLERRFGAATEKGVAQRAAFCFCRCYVTVVAVTQAAACGPRELVDAISGFVARKSGIDESGVRDIVERIVTDAGADAIERLQARLGLPADHWGYYEREPVAQRIHHQLAPI